MVENYRIARIENNKVVATNFVALDSYNADSFIDYLGWVRFKEIDNPTLLEFQSLSEEKYRLVKGKWWESYKDVVEISFEEARHQKRDEISNAFKQDILWTDEENQFYQKWTSLNADDTSYDEWHGKVIQYWNEAYIQKKANKLALSRATTLTHLRAMQYSPTHVDQQESLQTPYQTS